jgi:hypothetical protein
MISVVYVANLLAHEHSGERTGGGALVQSAIDPKILALPDVAEQLPQWHQMAEEFAHEPQGVRHG